jgi:hypothetical protein
MKKAPSSPPPLLSLVLSYFGLADGLGTKNLT